MTKTPFWEESYARPGRLDTFGGGKPGADVVEAASRIPPDSHVLDLGCGEGRNALYLAGLGHLLTSRSLASTSCVRRRWNVASESL